MKYELEIFTFVNIKLDYTAYFIVILFDIVNSGFLTDMDGSCEYIQ